MASYTNYLNQLQARELESNKSYDKAIIVLSAGAIALSVTFIKDIGPIDQFIKCYLILSWFLWIFSLLTMVSSFITSQKALRNLIIKVSKLNNDEKIEDTQEPLNTLTLVLNIFSGLFFVLGTLSFLYFSTQIIEVKQMKEKTPIERLNREDIIDIVKMTVETTVKTLKEKGLLTPIIVADEPPKQPKTEEKK